MPNKLGVAIALVLIFGVTVAVLVRVLPGPLRPTDYLVIGAVATFLCMLLLFFVLISGSKKGKPQ
jgi:hypothetical protein